MNIIKSKLNTEKEALLTLVAIIEDIQNGIPASIACKKKNIKYQVFLRYLKNLQNISADSFIIDTSNILSWKEILYTDIFEVKDMTDLEIPLDFEDSINLVIKELEKNYPNTAQVVNKYYKECMTLEEIAKEDNISRQAVHGKLVRARQIIRRNYLDILRHNKKSA